MGWIGSTHNPFRLAADATGPAVSLLGSPADPVMSLVENAYQAAVDAMTPAQKIERMLQLNQWAHWNVERCVLAELGPLPAEELKWQVALRYYGQNPECRQPIDEQLARVRSSRLQASQPVLPR